MAIEREHWELCDDCRTAVRICHDEDCKHRRDHYRPNVGRWGKIRPNLCSNCVHERHKAEPGYKA